MTTRAQLRKAALAGDGVQEVGGDHGPAWSVDGEVFAAARPGGAAWLALPEDEAQRMAGEIDAVEVVSGGVVSGGVEFALSQVSGMAVNYWTDRAWRWRAGGERVGGADASAATAAAEDDDFGAVGAPARRALHGAGISSLEQLAGRSRDEIAGLHGIGPKVIERLARDLSQRGVDW